MLFNVLPVEHMDNNGTEGQEPGDVKQQSLSEESGLKGINKAVVSCFL